MKLPLETRFWSKVDIRSPDECWPWKASCSKQTGYGKFGKGGKYGGWIEAHRVAYELTNGPVPPGFLVMHSCDYRPCCNPLHLFAGTTLDNILDKVRKGIHRWKTPYGETAGTAKLTRVQVAEIKSRHVIGDSRAALARDYGVSWTQIARIVTGRSWAWLQKEL